MKINIIKKKEEIKGITLVALAVTIIVLLILAGVVILFTLGENGIFKRAKEGVEIYQNEVEKEKVELDKVTNYIDDYNNGSSKEDEESLLEVEESIKNGIIYKENTTIYDKYKNPVKVPEGFKLAADSGTDVTQGIVIEDAEAGDEDTKGNQYVWIPIGKIKISETSETKNITLGRYDFENNSSGEIKQTIDDYTGIITINSSFQELTSSRYGNTVAKNIGDFLSKANSSGGYYIGRFETGKVGENTNTFNIKKEQEVYNEITQANAANLARNLYSSNSNFESDLINSYAYDTAIIFIQTFSGDEDYSKQIPLQSALTTTGNSHDDNNNYDVRCNIYDMSGNVMEWSTETYTDNNTPCTKRGGYYNSSHDYTAHRTYYRTNYSNNTLGFRSIIYV